MRPFTLKWFSKVLGTFLLLIPVHTAQADTGDLGLYEKLKAATASQPNNLIRFDPAKPGDSTRPELKKTDPKTRLKVEKSFSAMPLMFEENKGQTSDEVRFYSRGRGYNFYLTPTESVMVLSKTIKEHPGPIKEPHRFDPRENMDPPKIEQSVVRMEVVGANKKATIKGQEKLKSTSHYFVGNDKSKWRQGVAHYQKVHYEEVYKGIDLVYYGNQSKLEYDFIVKPGADPKNIELNFKGADNLSLNDKGDLILKTKTGNLVQHKPIVYQMIVGGKQSIEGRYVLKENNRVAFQVAAYNEAENLVIDPVLGFSTYLGGNTSDEGSKIILDNTNHIYLIGTTGSSDFPVLNEIEGQNETYPGWQDIFITKLAQSDNTLTLIYSTYLGGGGDDIPRGIALDNFGGVYIAGHSTSSNFNLVNEIEGFTGRSNGFQINFDDVIVFKLQESGNVPSLAWSTYLGGNDYDLAMDIAVGNSGNVYVAGWTSSDDFDLVNPVDDEFSQKEAFLLKIEQSGNIPSLLWSTFIGGSNGDAGTGIALDENENIYLTGYSGSSDFPSVNPIEGKGNGTQVDVFVLKLEQTTDELVIAWSTLLGGSQEDIPYAIALDNSNHVYVAGETQSNDFDLKNEIEGRNQVVDPNFPYDAFVFKLEQSQNIPSLAWSTYLGGNDGDAAFDITTDSNENVYLTGHTMSTDFNIANAIEGNSIEGSLYYDDAFILKIKQDQNFPSLVYSTYLGGKFEEWGYGISLDTLGNVYVIGGSYSPNFDLVNPLEEGIYTGGYGDVIFFKLVELPVPTLNDIDGDGTSDLLAMETLFGTVAAGSIENATVTNIQGLVQAAPNLGWAVSSTGDFNGDTNADLLLYNTTTGEIRLVLLDGFTILSDTVVHTLNTAEGFVPFTTGNFNASTIDEIVLYNATSGAVDLLYLQAGAFYKREPVSGVPDIASGWQLIGSGLFDASRKFDLLWHNTLTTEIAYSEIDGSTQVSLVNFGPAPSPDWVPVGTADYNNDGKDDVLLWDTVNRTLGAWLQDSGTVLSPLVFGTLPTTLDYLNSGDYNGDGLADLLIWDPATGAVLAVLQDGTAITSVPFLLFLDTAAGWTVIPGKL
ncbi:MAG: SBBP repeat-containing protein [Nitrospina sp.]|nr:SBBP repeat-containing protein [Nitrospina sp.]